MTSGFAACPGSSTTLIADACATRLHGPTTNSASVFHRRPVRWAATGRANASASGSGRFAFGLGGATGLPNRSIWGEDGFGEPRPDGRGGSGGRVGGALPVGSRLTGGAAHLRPGASGFRSG